MIDLKKLKQLIDLMVDNDLTELDLQDENDSITLRRGAEQPSAPHAAPPPPPPTHYAQQPAPPPANAQPQADDGLSPIESPMVGTFYAQPDPESPPFISPGAKIGPDTVVCLVEAMKVFNEVKAECSGVVERVLVKNGESIEFGQQLFLVRPS